jgi:hypothetical protein
MKTIGENAKNTGGHLPETDFTGQPFDFCPNDVFRDKQVARMLCKRQMINIM